MNKVVCVNLAGDFDEALVVEQQRAENEFLRVEIGGKTLFQRDAAEGHGHGDVCQNSPPACRILTIRPAENGLTVDSTPGR